jgi:hypothetical protein
LTANILFAVFILVHHWRSLYHVLMNARVLIIPVMAFAVTALFARTRQEDCTSCRYEGTAKDNITVGKILNLSTPPPFGRNGSLLVVVGLCRSCAMKHVDRNLVQRSREAGFEPVLIEEQFTESKTLVTGSSKFEGCTVLKLPYDEFQLLATTFLPRLIWLDKHRRVIKKQDEREQFLEVPK